MKYYDDPDYLENEEKQQEIDDAKTEKQLDDWKDDGKKYPTRIDG